MAPDTRKWMDTGFLERLLAAPGPSGFEERAIEAWCDQARTFADTVRVDSMGNAIAILGPGTPEIALIAHIDEIGLQITHIEENGLLAFGEIGGWDPQVLVGQRVRVLCDRGDVVGVIGRRPMSLLPQEDRQRGVRCKDLWLDIGADDRGVVGQMGIRVGDPAVIDQAVIRIGEHRVAGPGIDNRVGTFVILEALRQVSEYRIGTVAAVASVQEEIGRFGGGAGPAASSLVPNAAVVVDVTHSSDVPGVEKREFGACKLGGGVVVGRGSAGHRKLTDSLVDLANANAIPHSLLANPRLTRTDADIVAVSAEGIPTAVVMIPTRYMHSPSETADLRDVAAAIELLSLWIRQWWERSTEYAEAGGHGPSN